MEGISTNLSSGTLTLTEQQQQQQQNKEKVLVLKLREKAKGKLKWAEGTVDNEHMGKKSSKRCCIYHKNRQFAESDSDESDSDVEIAAHQPRKPDQPPNYQRFHA
eukprot:gene6670-7370_t